MRLLSCFAVSLVTATVPDIDPSTTIGGYLHALGIPLEDHYKTTADGYILHLHRLPRPGKAAIFLQHGILASSWCWLSNTPNASLAIVLWSRGYDVWLGNSRGNTFSRNHTHLSPSSSAFWNYTFDEMGRQDDPASVEYVASVVGRTITFIGWSQGNTAFLIGSQDDAARVVISSHVNLYIGVSPVSYLSQSKSTLLNALSKLGVAAAVEYAFPYGFLKGSAGLHLLEEILCKATFGALCKLTVDAVCGVSDSDSPAMIERMAAHFPAGTSVKDMNHYAQFISSNTFYFGRYDYGTKGNEREYNSPTPPSYDLSRVPALPPLAFFLAGSDDLVPAEDAMRMLSGLADGVKVFLRTYEGFSHVTWISGTEAAWAKWSADLWPLLDKYNPL